MSELIHVKLPDGSVKEVPSGTTALDIAKGISPRLADAALAAQIKPAQRRQAPARRSHAPIRKRRRTPPPHRARSRSAGSFSPLLRASPGRRRARTFPRDQARPRPRHRERILLRLLSREAVHSRRPGGDREEDAGAGQGATCPTRANFCRATEGLERFKAEGDFMKCHFIEQFTKPDEKISIYKTGKFIDFCRGPHIPSTGRIKAFKLLNIAGAYWLGDEKNPQLQRIYGTSFFSKKDLDEYLQQAGRGQEARPSRARQAARPVLHPGTRRPGPDLLASQGRHHPQDDGRLDARRVPEARLLAGLHAARRAPRLWKTSGHEGYLRAKHVHAHGTGRRRISPEADELSRSTS